MKRTRKVQLVHQVPEHLRVLSDLALRLAQEAVQKGNHPFSAVVFPTDRPTDIVCTAVNQVNQESDLTAHAEIVAIRDAGKILKLNTGQGETLKGYSMLVLADPCPMCMGALLWAQMDALYFLFHRDSVAPLERPNLSKLYSRFSCKNDMYDEVACTQRFPLYQMVPFEKLSLDVYKQWSIKPKSNL